MSVLSRRDFMQLTSAGPIASLLSAARDTGNGPANGKNIIADEKVDQRL